MVDGADPLTWPLRLTWGTLAGQLAAIEIEASPTSPITRFLSSASSVAAERPAREALPALDLLARPRQVLVVRVREDLGPLSMFLSDGALVARFDCGSKGCIVSKPSGLDEFTGFVSTLVPRQASALPPLAITRTSFESLRQLRRIGLFAADGGTVPLAVAVEAIGRVARGRDPLEILRALARDEIVVLDGDDVRAGSDWARNAGPAGDPVLVSIRAAQCGDGTCDRSRDKTLLMLGDDAGAVAYLAPHADDPRMDTIVDIVPATAPVIAAAVQDLLAPPLAPPSAPIADRARAPDFWLTSEPDGDPSRNMGWREDTLEDAAARFHLGRPDAPPAALLSPSATITVLTRHGAEPVARHVFAIDDHAAVEWTLRGSRLLWREHDAHSLADRVEGLADSPQMTGDQRWFIRAVAQVDGAARVFEHRSQAAVLGGGGPQPPMPGAQLRREISEAWRMTPEAGR